MNVRVDEKGAVLTSARPLQVAPPALAKTEPPKGHGPVYQSGPYKNLYVRDIEALGLDKINWVGITPVTANPPKDRWFMRACATGITRGIMRLWNTGGVKPCSPGLNGPIHGALVVIGPHVDLSDPPWNYSNLYPLLKARPVATEGTFTQPFVKRSMQLMNGLPVPDTSNLLGTSDEMKLLVAQVVAALRRGENIGIHLAGELLRDNIERIGANSLVDQVLKIFPEARILTANTNGMNGSEFGWAGAGRLEHEAKTGEQVGATTEYAGHSPEIGAAAKAHIGDALYNWRHLRRASKERRDGTIELRDVTEAVKAEKAVRAQNAIFEALSNRPDPVTGVPNQPWYIPRRYDDPRPRAPFAPPVRQTGDLSGEVNESEVPAITDKVKKRLESLGIAPEKLRAEAKLADLGLDSLAITSDVLLWVNNEFKRFFTSPEAFNTVGDVINGATGRLKPTAGIEFKPVSAAYTAQLGDTTPVSIAKGATNVVDGFLKLVRTDPNRIVQVDEVQGEVTAQEMARLVWMLVPELEKIPGKYVAMLFANSVMGRALELALPLAGKTPAMLNPQWPDKNAKAAMERVGAECIVSAQRVIRAMKGLKEMGDAELVKKGLKTAEEVAADPTRTPFASVEDKFFAIDDTLRNLSEVKGVFGSIFANKMMKDLEARARRIKPDDDAVVIFTSGSTGTPKAIAYSHRAVLNRATVLAKRFHLTKGDSLLHMAPSFHLVGYMAGMMASLMGIATVNVSNPKAAAIAAQQGLLRNCTITVSSPSLVATVCDAGTMPLMKRVIVGAEALKPVHEAKIRKAMPNAALLQGFGATETGVTFVETADPRDPSKRTLGTALEGVEYLLVDENDPTKILPPGSDGLLLLRGEGIVSPESGYIGDAPKDAFVTVGGKTYYNTDDIVRPHQVVNENGEADIAIEHLYRNRKAKYNGKLIGLGGVETDLKSLFPESLGGVIAVQGPSTPSGGDTLVAYVVPARDEKTGKAIMRDGSELTFEKVQQGLTLIHGPNPEWNIAELRIVDEFKLAGTGKADLSYYREAGTKPHDGVVVR